MEEITLEGTDETIRYFMWGLYLSQNLQGAGGVGGLLAVIDLGVTYHVSFDANGNVTQLVNAADETISAHYEYDPYAKNSYYYGSYTDENSFRFGTKHRDYETRLVYYGYRYYSFETGRWVSREPSGEEDGANLYHYVQNNPITQWDLLGLKTCKQKRGYKPKCNGCGPESSKLLNWMIPDRALAGYDFTPACNEHDTCYGTCCKNKDDCDRAFFGNMKKQCDKWIERVYGPNANIINKILNQLTKSYFKDFDRNTCYGFATMYFLAVSTTETGKNAYQCGQIAACECPPSSYKCK